MTSDRCPVSGETAKEEQINHWTHVIGLVLSVIGFPVLIIYSALHGDFWDVVSFSIYGFTLVLLYIVSAFYHGCMTLERKGKLRIIDHVCIYLLIAGSYTPFTLGPLRDTDGWILLTIEWSIAVVGILFKVFAFNRFQTLSLIAYLVMGWLIVFSWPALTEKISLSSITLLTMGGISYSLGILFFLWRSLPFNHAIWHLFVMGGSFSHYCAVMLLIS